MTHKHSNPVNYWDQERSWQESFQSVKIEWLSDDQIAAERSSKPCFQLQGATVLVLDKNPLNLPIGDHFTKFEILTHGKFKGNAQAAWTWVGVKYMNTNLPFLRVADSYYKITHVRDRYDVLREQIKAFKKEEIKADHGPAIMPLIPKFDDFCIVPDNMNYSEVVDNCYNLYHPFSHKPWELSKRIKDSDIKVSMGLMRHIFGDQLEMGIKYLKLLYENPRQALPILCLVSKERQTGKTTFLNWMNIMFGQNYCQINPEDLGSQFNSAYATKNVIALDETVIDKSHAVEKLKSIATAKTISVNQKFVANYSVPFFGKVIICTNKEMDFMRIDEEEIRFWIRKVPQITSINTNIENDLTDEVPAFLRYLINQPAVDTKRSRMVFTAEELHNESLLKVKKESHSQLRKDFTLIISDYFYTNGHDKVQATLSELKEKFFKFNANVGPGYLRKMLTQEMRIKPVHGRYKPIDTHEINSKVGMYYTFLRSDFVQNYEIPPDPEPEQPF
jgi:hypothetical protein